MLDNKENQNHIKPKNDFSKENQQQEEEEEVTSEEILEYLTNASKSSKQLNERYEEDKSQSQDTSNTNQSSNKKVIRVNLKDLKNAGFDIEDISQFESYAVMGKASDIPNLVEKEEFKQHKIAKAPSENKNEQNTPITPINTQKPIAGKIPVPESDPTLFSLGGGEDLVTDADPKTDFNKEVNINGASDNKNGTQTIENSINNAFNLNSADAENELALYDLHKVTITENEKENYLRSLLNNEVFKDVLKFKDISIQICSKTMELQMYLAEKINKYANESYFDSSENKYKAKHTPVDLLKYALYLNVIFCVESVNGENIFKNELKYTLSSEQREELIKNGIKIIECMPTSMWNLLLNAVRIFDRKEFLLGKEMLSGDF